MPGLTEPLGADRAKALRRLVLAFKAAEHRRVFEPVLHLASPGGLRASYDIGRDEVMDPTLRTDVVAALLLRARTDTDTDPPLVWMTRRGELAWHDVDASWLTAADAAYSEAGLPLTMVVVTRLGWYDPRSGVRRQWRRLRER